MRKSAFPYTFCLGLVVFAGALPSSLENAQAQGLFGLTEEQEIALGRQAAAEVESTQPLLHDRQVEAYVNNLGQTLARRSGRPRLNYRFQVINSSDINAFALPGGFVYLNRGVIENAGSESELAGVMAHEIGHVVARHSAEQLKRLQITGLGLGLLDAFLGRGPACGQ